MSGIAFVQVNSDTLKKIACPGCKKIGVLEFTADGSSAAPISAIGDAPQAICCSNCEFDGNEEHPAIQDGARQIRGQASLR
jgi:hypothetical protein